MVKATYSLDKDSLSTLNRLARSWQVSKTEVLRRALKQAAAKETEPTPEERLAAFHDLQRNLAEKKTDFTKWQRDIKRGRR